ncbi:MAG: peptidoglycan editing factor PgeF [Eubacteriales bacterium]|nr:peptidoglycan editing factor PgeF [Eubacteriales bacterium]
MIAEETDVYKLREKAGAKFLTFKRLDREPGLKAIFTTRWGGISEGCCENWNFGFSDRDTDACRAYNYKKLAEVMGTDLEHLIVTDQTHTTNVEVVDGSFAGYGLRGILPDADTRRFHDVDGLVTNVPGLALVTHHSDCNALYFYDPYNRAIGLAHSGWKGTLNGIGPKLVGIMEEKYGTDPGRLLCGLGPSICGDCFEIDEDVANLFFDKCPAYRDFSTSKVNEACLTKYYLDLWSVNRYMLEKAGLDSANIFCMGLCTKENLDTFFSHRGQRGKRGTMAACMMLEEM